MKNMKKCIVSMMLLASMLFLLVGCSNSKNTVEEMGETYLKACIERDISIFEDEYGQTLINNAGLEESLAYLETALKKTPEGEAGGVLGFRMSDEDISKFISIYYDILSKSECKDVTVINVDDDEAELEFEQSCIDIKGIYDDCAEGVVCKYQDKSLTGEIDINSTETIKMMENDFKEIFFEMLSKAELDSTITYKYKFKNKPYPDLVLFRKDFWIPKGESGFISKAGLSALGIKDYGNLFNFQEYIYGDCIDEEYEDDDLGI